ncbi:MAG TPA: hypothetical protein PKD49_11225 [Hyphomicrobium sp.]|nr:hypothetical protein [Hyphomicrobium sp.]
MYKLVKTTFAPIAFAIIGGVSASAGDLGQCPGVDLVETELKNSSSSGYFIPGLKLIVMNKTVLDNYAPAARKFIFAHECAHSDPAVAEDEMAADCAASRTGASEGWLTRPDVIKVCAHLARFPADATHPPIGVRCGNIRRCSGLFDDGQPLQSSAREAKRGPEPTPDAAPGKRAAVIARQLE